MQIEFDPAIHCRLCRGTKKHRFFGESSEHDCPACGGTGRKDEILAAIPYDFDPDAATLAPA